MSDCPHCDPASFAFQHILEETMNFRIVCDVHPLTEGHILLVPKAHLVCMGAVSEKEFEEFRELYNTSAHFIAATYGSVSTFEHGVIGQTVFHAHVHLLPYTGTPESIVPEGRSHLTLLEDLSMLRTLFLAEGKYLFYSLDEQRWLVDTALGTPRFFRDRFAVAFGKPERGNWKVMHANPSLMAEAQREIGRLRDHWREYQRAQEHI